MTEPAGAFFKTKDIVDHYRYRPPYPAGVYDRIVASAPGTGCLVDLGCGEGKLARPMTDVFDQVVAIDPSEHMLRLGKALPKGRAQNIRWVKALAETAPLPDAIDVVTFGSSIHWMDPIRLFPRLKKRLNEEHILVVIEGDEPFLPPWHDDWREFLSRWVPEMTGRALDAEEWIAWRNRHLDHMEVIHACDELSDPIKQSLDEFVLCQHSRDTFATIKLGERIAAFQDEFVKLLRPHADDAGLLEFRVKSRVTLARLVTL
ncbi:MAG: class I SAM-dependent methyltransferase [Pseudomonadota bacterium]